MKASVSRVWSVFSTISALGKLYVYPARGGYDWTEVHAYTLRKIERLGFTDEKFLAEARKFWSEMDPNEFAFTAAATEWFTPAIFGVYAYDEGDDPVQVIQSLLASGIAPENCNALGLEPGYQVERPHLLEIQEDKVMTGVLDMRITLLHERLGISRTAPSLGTVRGLLASDDAIEDNWRSMCTLATLPGLGEGERTEAAHLVYRMGLQRFDLYDRTKELGVPMGSDPELHA